MHKGFRSFTSLTSHALPDLRGLCAELSSSLLWEVGWWNSHCLKRRQGLWQREEGEATILLPLKAPTCKWHSSFLLAFHYPGESCEEAEFQRSPGCWRTIALPAHHTHPVAQSILHHALKLQLHNYSEACCSLHHLQSRENTNKRSASILSEWAEQQRDATMSSGPARELSSSPWDWDSPPPPRNSIA